MNAVTRFFQTPKTTYACTALIFRALLALIYFTVFFSLLFQTPTLMGSKGLMPVANIVQEHPELHYANFPTVHLWLHGDNALMLLLMLGLIASLMLFLGAYPRIALLACIVLYLSYVTSGLDFFAFQWDNLLLEASFLALFLPLAGKLKSPEKLVEPAPALLFLFRWLLFRLYFESGVAKLLYGQHDWLKLTAMDFYYQTAPLPSFGGWFAQQLAPHWFHAATIIAVFALELLVPLFLFWPRRARIISFWLLAALNVGIGVTGNYGFFNILSIFIGIFLLDDQYLLAFKKCRRWLGSVKTVPAPNYARHAALLLALFIVPFSLIEFVPFASPSTHIPGIIADVQHAYAPFRLINTYHLFPGIVPERIVIEIQGSRDGKNWQPYVLKHTPQQPDTMPPLLPLYQARFPFSYSFITNDQLNTPYFNRLIAKLCTAPDDVQTLFAQNPFPAPPQEIRLVFYRYAFSTPHELLTEGVWWDRDIAGQSQTVACATFA